MTQNRSHAVMAQRHEPHDSLDDFPTPPWATRALVEQLRAQGIDLSRSTVWEPAANRGHMVRPLSDACLAVYATDVHDYGVGYGLLDFLFPVPPSYSPDWIVTNPPFRLAAQFAARALSVAEEGVALLVRSSWLEGVERHRSLFGPRPPSLILQFVERVPMVRGRLDGTASTATAYCWVVWLKKQPLVTRFRWIAPCRKRLERAEDYR